MLAWMSSGYISLSACSLKNSTLTFLAPPKIGPIEFHEDVLQAMATPATSHVAPNFIPALGESIELLRQILFTSGQPFIIAGSGTLGWDMTACNLIEAGENVLVCNSGYFGDRFGEW